MGVKLNGATGYLRLPQKLVSAYPFSIGIRFAVDVQSDCFVISQGQSDADRDATLFLDANGSGNYARYRNIGDGNNAVVSLAIASTYRLAICVFESATSRKLFLGSNVPGASTSTQADNTSLHNQLVIGANLNNSLSGLFFNGGVAEAFVVPSAINSTQYDSLIADSIKPESISGCVCFPLRNITDLTDTTGTYTLTLVGGVTNDTRSHPVSRATPDVIAPTVSSAAVANGTPSVVNLTMSENMDTGSVPAASAFTVSGHTVSSVAITGNTINLTLSAPFVNGEAARTVAYTQPGTNNARDLAATPNLLANFTGQAITNNVAAPGDTTAPGFSLAQVLNSAAAQIVITMNETLAAFTPAASAFAVSGGKTVSSVARGGATITLTCSAAYAYGDTITVTYTKPGTNMLQDAAGNQTASFGPSAVTNSIAAPSGALVTLPGPLCRFPGGMPLVSESGKFQFLSKTDLAAAPLANVAKTASSTGTVTPWTQSGLTAGVTVRCRWISDADGQEANFDVTPT